MPFTIIRQATVPNGVGIITRIENHGPGSLKAEWKVLQGRSYTSKLKVQTSSPYVGAIQVIQSVAPKWGAYYRWPLVEFQGTNPMPLLPVEQDTGSFLQSITAEPDGDDGKQWILTLEYTPFDVEHEVGEQDENGVIDPTKKRPEVSWGSSKYERSEPQDKSDPPQFYRNTAGDPLLDPPPNEESRPILTIKRAELKYDESWIDLFVDHVNSTPFLGYPPNTVKCSDIDASLDFDPDFGYFWEITYQFEFRTDTDTNGNVVGWDTLIPSRGYREKKNGTGDPVAVMISGAPPSDPVDLQKNGSYTAGADPYMLTFKQFKSADFTALNIPDDLLKADF